MISLFDRLNSEPWYCPTCMVAVNVTPIPVHNENAIELFCPRGHLVTRLQSDGTGNYDLDPAIYERLHTGHDNCKSVPRNPPHTTFFIPLNEQAIATIRAGKYIEEHVHDLRFTKGRMTFIVGCRQSFPDKKSKIAKILMKQGDVQPLPICSADINQLLKTDGASCCQVANTDLQVCVVTEKAMKRMEAEKKH